MKKKNFYLKNFCPLPGYISPEWLPQHKKSISNDFVEWFIGFTEGDGSFIVAKYKNKNGSIATYARHFFILNQKDPKALYKIRKNLGFGTIKKYYDKKQATCYYRYIVSDIDGIQRLIQIFNGNLVLNKTQQRFILWLNAFNQRPSARSAICKKKNQVNNLTTVSTNSLLSLNSAWLSGFIDAEGCFFIHYNKRRNYLYLRFIIDQKDEYLILEKIKILLNSGYIEKRNKIENMFSYVISYTKVLDLSLLKDLPNGPQNNLFFLLFKYLKKFPLKTNKNIDFIRFKKIWIRLHDGIIRESGTKKYKRLLRLIKTLSL